MSQEQINISHMQCWIFRMAQRKWNRTPEETAAIFQAHDIFAFIAEFYDTLHLSSYAYALEDIERMLVQKGVAVC